MIKNRFFYMNLKEWHHAYLGILVILSSFVQNGVISEVFLVLGVFILLDDLIQHFIQGVFIDKIKNKYPNHSMTIQDGFTTLVKGRSIIRVPLPQFLLHTLVYDYFEVNRFHFVKKVTKLFNKIFGKND